MSQTGIEHSIYGLKIRFNLGGQPMIPTFNTKEEYLSEIWIELTDNVIDKVFNDDQEAHNEFKLVTNYINWLRPQSFDAIKEAYQELVHSGAIEIV